jgi:peptidoglycan/LPS O-acetylase OafA/YrhL
MHSSTAYHTMNKAVPTARLLQTKQHFPVLDGLRGIAALAVVVFHFMEMVFSDYSKNFIGHGFLAVDFFFCLSGFVIGYAYDDRIKQLGVKEFFKSRLIRLHPLVLLGSVLGLLGFFFDPFGGHPELYSVGKILLLFLASVLLIPLPIMADRYFNLFGLNAPAWSLFWEYVANMVYALVLYRMRRSYHILFIVLSAAGVCYVIVHAGSIMGGWGGSSFRDGFVRVSYSFLAGLFIYRQHWLIPNRLGFAGLCVLLAIAFLSPFSQWNWLTESVIVLLYFPLLIALGAGTTVSAVQQKLCTFSGNISYPLYMTHYAVIWMFGNYYTTHKPAMGQVAWVIAISVVLLVGFAYLVMVVYDIPVRQYLAKKRKRELESKPIPVEAKPGS